MGRYVWYAEAESHKKFLTDLFEFIQSVDKVRGTSPVRTNRGGAGWQVDPRRRKQIEQAAVLEVMRYYGKELGYELDDRQDAHCGWDLVARKHGIELYLEVKGVGGVEIDVELSPNEYECMKKHRGIYRICIVTNALSKAPKLSIYGYVAESRQWEHHQDGTPLTIKPVWVQTARLHSYARV